MKLTTSDGEPIEEFESANVSKRDRNEWLKRLEALRIDGITPPCIESPMKKLRQITRHHPGMALVFPEPLKSHDLAEKAIDNHFSRSDDTTACPLPRFHGTVKGTPRQPRI